MNGSAKAGLILVVAGVSIFAVGLAGDMDIIPKFSQWEGIPLNILGVLLALSGIVVVALSTANIKLLGVF
jgi:hypothetical protein